MKDSVIQIKKNNRWQSIYIFFSLVMIAASVFCLILPHINEIDGALLYVFIAMGAIGLLYFTYSFSNLVYQAIKPPAAVLISTDGFYDDVYGIGLIPWDNVADIKSFSGGDCLAVGITLNSLNELDGSIPARLFKLLNDNREANIPEIVIKQSDIKCSLIQFERMMIKHREASSRDASSRDASGRDAVDHDMGQKPRASSYSDDNAKTRHDMARIVSENIDNYATAEILDDEIKTENDEIDTIRELFSSPKKSKPEAIKPAEEKIAQKTPTEREKSIEDMLSELSGRIKTDGGETEGKSKLNAELEAIIEELRKKNKNN